jgi:hypothetical protein
LTILWIGSDWSPEGIKEIPTGINYFPVLPEPIQGRSDLRFGIDQLRYLSQLEVLMERNLERFRSVLSLLT